ncbi:MAG: cystathionine gamma-synthase [Planctomycetaceae bacterium]|nr:MAG: cystathionine gamma-synthase [Planctomycetaceae bacterium]
MTHEGSGSQALPESMQHPLASAIARPQSATFVARAGQPDPIVTPPSAPPLYLTTAFDLEDLDQLEEIGRGVQHGFIYTRDGNPNQEALARDLAWLEGAERGVVTASGMGALTAILSAHLRPGDQILASRGLYGRSDQLLRHWADHAGIVVRHVDVHNLDEVRRAVHPGVKMCLVESVSNPLVEVADLPALVEILRDVPLVVDNTFATPCLLQPCRWGATLVWHSGSKYLNGHGDVMLGAVVGRAQPIRAIRHVVALAGLNSNPFESWLVSRGLRTLSLRMQRVSETAERLAQFLQHQPGVVRVCYPSLPSQRTAAVAQRLLTQGHGGMLAFEVEGGRARVNHLFRRWRQSLPFSPTLADARTTVSHPYDTSHKFLPVEERLALGITPGLIRLSVGLEDPRDLEHELASALAA